MISAAPPAGIWRVRGATFDLSRRALVLGVLNVTPDSFSDGGRYADPERASERALALADEGADLLDVGGESTRPGARPVPATEEIARVRPVLERLAGRLPIPISIDTRKAEVAEVALDLGAGIVNDISGLAAGPALAAVAARHGAGLLLMHMQGSPETMQHEPRYADVVAEVGAFLDAAAERAEAQGVPREAIAFDPGIGFGKTLEHNLALLRGLSALAAHGRPLCVGVSRKSFFEMLLGLGLEERLEAGLAAAVFAYLRGARIVRTHDVRATVRALRTVEALG
jgi:dihydropteroate synthase